MKDCIQVFKYLFQWGKLLDYNIIHLRIHGIIICFGSMSDCLQSDCSVISTIVSTKSMSWLPFKLLSLPAAIQWVFFITYLVILLSLTKLRQIFVKEGCNFTQLKKAIERCCLYSVIVWPTHILPSTDASTKGKHFIMSWNWLTTKNNNSLKKERKNKLKTYLTNKKNK